MTISPKLAAFIQQKAEEIRDTLLVGDMFELKSVILAALRAETTKQTDELMFQAEVEETIKTVQVIRQLIEIQ